MKARPFFFQTAFVLATVCLFFSQANAQSGTKPQLVLYKFNAGVTLAQQGDLLGELIYRGLTAPGVVRQSATIESWATGPVNAGSYPANLVFRTSGPVGDPQDRMVITELGRVGIGTLTPGFNLEVVGNTHTTGDFFGRIHMDAGLGTAGPGPNTYLEEAYFEYKLAGDLGVTDNTTNGGLLTLAPSNNDNTVKDHQLFFNAGGIYHRDGDGNAAAWSGTWERLLSSGDIAGTPNRVVRFLPPDDPSNTLGNSQLFDNGTNVVIGGTAAPFTSMPAFDAPNLFTVNGQTEINGLTYVNGRLGVGNAAPAFPVDVTGNSHFDGMVGIGTLPNAAFALDVNGDANFQDRVKIGATAFPTDAFYELAVGGGIMAEEVRVLAQPWPDYVFEPEYQMPDLYTLEQYIRTHKHLPGIPKATEVAQEGVALGEMNRLLLEKVEELTLLVIAQQKQLDALRSEINNR